MGRIMLRLLQQHRYMASRMTPEPILTAAAMRAAEAASGLSDAVLIDRAARAAAAAIISFGVAGDVLVACGPGRNGSDGYGVASLLGAAGYKVRVAVVGAPQGAVPIAAAAIYRGECTSFGDAAPAALFVDAVFGAGLRRPIADVLRGQLAQLAAHARARFALDLPSGIDADSGIDLGAFSRADLTIAFGAFKPGHLLYPGRGWCGRLVVADLRLGPLTSPLHRTAPPVVALPAAETQKYARGAVLVLGGDAGAGGAARLTARAALRSGAGLVMLGVPPAAVAENAARCDAVMVGPLADAAAVSAMVAGRRFAAVAAGPGLTPTARPLLEALLAKALPAVLDAGIFTLFAGDVDGLVRQLRGPAVLTPHAGEFVRLFGDLPGSKVARAQAAAQRSGAVIILKGPDTVIAAPDGRTAINDHASAWLATAGSGDVLTGVIAARLAQGAPAFEAACDAVWLHGDAGRRGGAGMTADDLPELVARALQGCA